MVRGRRCSAIKQAGQRCQARPLHDESFCFWHHPDYAADVAKARKLGGHRRRREGALQGEYDFEGLATVADIRRLLEIAVMDALGLDNTIVRVRVLIAGGIAAAKLLEIGELEERLGSLETALGTRTLPNTGRR